MFSGVECKTIKITFAIAVFVSSQYVRASVSNIEQTIYENGREREIEREREREREREKRK